MIDVQKAIEILKSSMWECHGEYFLDVVQSKEMAEKALEKQMAKAVVYPDKNYSGLPVAQCPVCGNRGVEYGNCFCSKCGQKLDWSDKG